MEWTRVNNDVNGNPRYVVHFLECMPKKMEGVPIVERYEKVVKLMNKIGGKKFHNKQYGGGIVFSSYHLPDEEKAIERLKAEYDAKK